MLKISEIFYSIQGEGYFVGSASIFIRMYACDLKCGFCDDTSHRESYKEYGFEDVLEEIKIFEAKNIVITGGEPSQYNLNDFIIFLKNRGYFVNCETNGLNLNNIKNSDWITYSPKNLNKILRDGFNEIKFLIDKNDANISEIIEFDSKVPMYLQPINFLDTPNMENLKFCVELVKKYPKFRLSPQIHKLIGER